MTRCMPQEKRVKIMAKARRLIDYGFTREGAIGVCLDYYQANANRPETIKRMLREWG